MKLVYNVNDKPKFGQVIVFALQQVLAILAATIAVPAIVGNGMSQSAALFGAGVGTLVYLLFTKFKSPVFLGSSFAFLPSMFAAFGGAASVSVGYLGLIIGAFSAGLVYVIIAVIVKIVGVKWIDKIMPPVVIGPTVALIGLSLAVNAVNDSVGKSAGFTAYDSNMSAWIMTKEGFACIAVALVTLFAIIICSIFGKKFLKMIPFIVGIVAGYVAAVIVTFAFGIKLVDFSAFSDMKWIPDFSFVKAIDGLKEISFEYIVTIIIAYAPVAAVVFAEHIADHKNLSSIIEKDLLEDPGLANTLLGDGVGSMAGAFFGGCPNTTYGESIGCVAISGNASITTILTTAIMAIVAAFFAPFTTFLATIPSCVMGGVCIALYGFIAVSGLKMIQGVDLGDNRNLFSASAILITGIGGMALLIGEVKISAVVVALALGIIINAIGKLKK